MSEASARNNVLVPLKRMGFVDEEGNLNQDLAGIWRSDEAYSEACQQILERVYPPGLLDALPPPDPDVEAAKAWFMRSTGVGDAAAKRMAVNFRLLAEADLSRRESPNTSGSTTKKETRRKNSQSRVNSPSEAANQSAKQTNKGSNEPRVDPAIHVNVQVHISAESTPEQVDKIFSSMRKYLIQGSISDE